MRKYLYVGSDPLLKKHTALGRYDEGIFMVQVDDISHPWSHGWHITDRDHWIEVIECCVD